MSKLHPVSRGAAGLAFLAGLVCLALGGVLGDPPASDAPAAQKKPTEKTAQCATPACHADVMARKVLHGPTAQKKCDACHAYDEPREHTFKLTADPAKLCDTCHTLKHRTVVHAPVRDGQCTGCHDPHGSDHKTLLVADPTRGLCQKCHTKEKNDFMNKKFMHGPVAVGACILCHDSHSSWEPKLLVKAKGKLCLDCHTDTVQKAEKARYVHEPVKTDCSQCHDPHASDAKFQLIQDSPKLCFSCHKDIEKDLAGAKVVHGPAKGPGGCLDCHNTHTSELPKLQKAVQPQSCLSCHNQKLKDEDGKALTDMAELLKENPEQHGPIREGSCTACHNPHAGQRFRLLTHDYPPEFYAPFKIERYALCFDCHIPQLVLAENGRGLTRFRKGDQNLHWLHVNKEKGRTCRACHEVHASKHAFHIRESVPFGESGWMLEINFEPTKTGGSCSPGCHRKAEYDRGAEAAPSPDSVKPGGLK